MNGKDEYIDMIMGPVMRSTILLTVVISMKRTQITSLLLSHTRYCVQNAIKKFKDQDVHDDLKRSGRSS